MRGVQPSEVEEGQSLGIGGKDALTCGSFFTCRWLVESDYEAEFHFPVDGAAFKRSAGATALDSNAAIKFH